MPQMHSFTKGQTVTVLNQTWGGKVIIEGQAKIVRPVRDVDEQYLVQFMRDGRPQLGEKYERFIDPAAQADPEAYVAKLNSPN